MSTLFIRIGIINYKGPLFMDIEGTYTLQATPKEVWQCLANRQTLLHTIPEIEKLERVDEYTHTLALHFTYAPLVGTYYGSVRVAESHSPNHARLVIESVRDTQGTMSGEAIIDLQSHEDTTIVSYKGDVNLHKPNIPLQRTVVKGAAKLLIQQFFTGLEEQLWQQQAAKKFQSHTSQDEIQRVTILQRIVHLLRIGKGNITEEVRWTQRIRRTGYASMLLFLVWVGTRIPRR